MKAEVRIGKGIRVQLFDTDKADVAGLLSSYNGNVDVFMKKYNKAIRSELLSIGDDLKRKLMLEIGAYINGKNKIATKKLWNSIYKEVNDTGNNKLILEVGSSHPMIGAILRGQGDLGLSSKGKDYPPGAINDLENNLKQWISKKRIAFYYWYEGPRVGRKLRRMDKSRTLFLLMRSIGKIKNNEEFHQGVLPSNFRYQKTTLPTLSSSGKRGTTTSVHRPSKAEYYHKRSDRLMLEQAFNDMIPEIAKRLQNVKSSFSEINFDY